MEIVILDSLLRPIDVVDLFESMIWTERYSEAGDFELLTQPSQSNIKRFVVGAWITINRSRRVMRVETVETTLSSSKMMLKVKGRDIVSVLEMRAALQAIAGPSVAPVWFIPDETPGDIMRYIFDQICVEGTISSADIIPYIQPGETLYPVDTIPEPSALIDWEQKPASVYSAIKELGDIYDLGFRLYKDPNTASLYFDVYSGSDRTTAQSTLPPVIFSPDMENLQDTTEYNSMFGSYNVAHVVYIYKDEVTETDVAQSVIVYDDDTDPSIVGFERRVKIVNVTTIPEEVVDITAFLTMAGKDELKKSRPIGAFDGEVTNNNSYVYEQDFYLGDLVETRGISGATSYMRVEEYIFVEDDEGERSYPTLTTKKFIDPGTWLSWKYDVDWSAMGPDEYWSNQ